MYQQNLPQSEPKRKKDWLKNIVCLRPGEEKKAAELANQKRKMEGLNRTFRWWRDYLWMHGKEPTLRELKKARLGNHDTLKQRLKDLRFQAERQKYTKSGARQLSNGECGYSSRKKYLDLAFSTKEPAVTALQPVTADEAKEKVLSISEGLAAKANAPFKRWERQNRILASGTDRVTTSHLKRLEASQPADKDYFDNLKATGRLL